MVLWKRRKERNNLTTKERRGKRKIERRRKKEKKKHAGLIKHLAASISIAYTKQGLLHFNLTHIGSRMLPPASLSASSPASSLLISSLISTFCTDTNMKSSKFTNSSSFTSSLSPMLSSTSWESNNKNNNNVLSCVHQLSNHNNSDPLSNISHSSANIWVVNEAYARKVAPAMAFIALLMVIGTFGNLLVVYIYGFRFKSGTQHFLIACLACFDLIMCTVAMPTEIADMRFHHTFTSVFACKLLRFVTMFASISSSFTLVMVAYDRHKRITKPLRKQSNIKKAKIWTLISMFAALTFSWPTLILTGLRPSETGIPDLTGSDCSYSESFRKTKYPLAFNVVLGTGFLTIITVITIFYFRIWKIAKRRKSNLAKRNTIGSLSGQSISGIDDYVKNESESSDDYSHCKRPKTDKSSNHYVVSYSNRRCSTKSELMFRDDKLAPRFGNRNYDDLKLDKDTMLKTDDLCPRKCSFCKKLMINKDLQNNLDNPYGTAIKSMTESSSKTKNDVYRTESNVDSLSGADSGIVDETNTSTERPEFGSEKKINSSMSNESGTVVQTKDILQTEAMMVKENYTHISEHLNLSKLDGKNIEFEPLNEKGFCTLVDTNEIHELKTKRERTEMEDKNELKKGVIDNIIYCRCVKSERRDNDLNTVSSGVKSERRDNDLNTVSSGYAFHNDLGEERSLPTSNNVISDSNNLIVGEDILLHSNSFFHLVDSQSKPMDIPPQCLQIHTTQNHQHSPTDNTKPSLSINHENCSSSYQNEAYQYLEYLSKDPEMGTLNQKETDTCSKESDTIDFQEHDLPFNYEGELPDINTNTSNLSSMIGTKPSDDKNLSKFLKCSKPTPKLKILGTRTNYGAQTPDNEVLSQHIHSSNDSNKSYKNKHLFLDIFNPFKNRHKGSKPVHKTIDENSQTDKNKPTETNDFTKQETTNSPKPYRSLSLPTLFRLSLFTASPPDLGSPSSENSRKRKRNHTTGCGCLSRNLDKTTVVALAISSVFILSFLPFLTLMFIRGIRRDFDYHLHGASLCVYHIFLRFYFLNSAINPILYGVLNANFRFECLRMWRKLLQSLGQMKNKLLCQRVDTTIN